MADPRQPDDNSQGDLYRDGQDESSSDSTSPPEMSSGGIDRELLEQILQETLASQPGQGYFEMIVRFARRNLDRKITQPAVATALVEEILEQRFDRLKMPPECPEWVATSLLHDPDARDRLKQLWANAVKQANAN